MSGDPAVKVLMDMKNRTCSSLDETVIFSRSLLAVPLLIILDMLAIAFSLGIAYLIRTYVLPVLLPGFFHSGLLSSSLQNLWWQPFILVACMIYEELYQKRLPYWKEVEKILKACTLAVIFSIALLYLAKLSGEMSRTLVMMTWFMTAVSIPLLRYTGKLLLVKAGVWSKPVLVIGAGKTAELIASALSREKTMGYEIIGLLDDNPNLTGIYNAKSKKVMPVLGTFVQAEKIISQTRVQEVIVAAPGMPSKKLVELTNSLQPLVNNVMVVPDLFGLSMNGIEVEYFFEEQALLLNVKNRLKSTLNRSIKRLFDVLTGSILLLLCIPLLCMIAIAIKIDSRGPVFFAHERMGQGSECFTCYKFRTMYLEGESLLKKHLRKNPQARQEWLKYNKIKDNDPRVTRVGAVLRRFSLDELPQLINVVFGNMSLVGPRPYLMREKKQMGNWVFDIHVAKPGITGLWQVSGRNEIEFEGRLKLDVWYVRNWSLWLDIVMLLKTLKVVLKRDGAY
ncbi:exopolysaccharide biosynthesis polyprenyl glycosylphosphotransferase [Desulfofarcimen acetoxidans DSM 771]|uniref:Exopolysaccharide biosynthesis polyprenyl glycosylphosphotransferase n=1 Tax=Desulfofarcimen acetoxidans (strain ATCC 49208 / DSM 771 / KCTC 5769 / VKM B-1644 / 5575) TaxID=485916 RepID=C8VYU1_DESAS|nr:undecaprenyl-phosphate galactose phosphotransferase WbaP [Desulfofarcimen acetoxidans]ACV64812.1 exopolysaccharide biosynthesis polyprenyl glycosylphosphotransferase [Desulfofarcimen acetoxidans DSM 771]